MIQIERITEMIQQQNDLCGLLWTQEDKEEFAVLIVRECVKVMYDNAIERKVPPDINQTPTHYAIAVLKHFGVEDDTN